MATEEADGGTKNKHYSIKYNLLNSILATINNLNTIHANEISTTYSTGVSETTVDYVDNLVVASGGVSQLDVDTEVATLRDKDISYNNTLTSSMSLIGANTTNTATHANDIAVLNTKQLQNFNGTDDTNTSLTTNYQTIHS